MKKFLKPIIVVVFISILVFLGYSITKKINYKAEVAERIKTIPKFLFYTLDNEVFTNENLSNNGYKLFVYFNSECDYCQSEAKQIKDNLSNFVNTQIIFVSFEPINDIKIFAEKYQLLENENVIFLNDKNSEFSELFDANKIPFILLYSKENQLIKKYKGAVKIENILKQINN